MDQYQRQRIIEFCQEIDSLVTNNPQNSNWEVLDRLRLKMNDLLAKQEYKEAEHFAYKLYLSWCGEQEASCHIGNLNF